METIGIDPLGQPTDVKEFEIARASRRSFFHKEHHVPPLFHRKIHNKY